MSRKSRKRILIFILRKIIYILRNYLRITFRITFLEFRITFLTNQLPGHVYVVRQIRMGVNLKLSYVKLKFESEVRQIDSSFAHQIEILI